MEKVIERVLELHGRNGVNYLEAIWSMYTGNAPMKQLNPVHYGLCQADVRNIQRIVEDYANSTS
jgi:hypothetical protein